MGIHRERSSSPRGRRACRRGDRGGHALAPSGAGFREALPTVAAEAAHRRRSRARQNDPGGDAAAPGVLSGRAKRILIMTPKGVLNQWQIELREKFNLNWPIYDGRKLVRYPSPALRGQHQREVDRNEWHREPVVITSSHLMRRRERSAELLDQAEPWDLVVLDEAHHARRAVRVDRGKEARTRC